MFLSYNKLKLIFLSALILIVFAFLTSKLSATALIGLLFVSKFFIKILDLSLTIVPRHLLGLKGLMGVTASFLESKSKIGP